MLAGDGLLELLVRCHAPRKMQPTTTRPRCSARHWR
jgi:hypothetical protein